MLYYIHEICVLEEKEGRACTRPAAAGFIRNYRRKRFAARLARRMRGGACRCRTARQIRSFPGRGSRAFFRVQPSARLACGTEEKSELPDAADILRTGLNPRQLNCAVSLELFRKLPRDLRSARRGERLAAFLLLAETSAAIDFVGEEQNPEPDDAEGSAESLRAFIRFFGEIKASLDREKYSFAFAYACNRVIGVYAEFAAENKAEEIRLFDDFLKSESMALRVAAKERSAVVRLLMRHNFRAPFWLRPVCAAAAAKARARR